MHEYNLHTSWLYGGGRHQLARPYKRLYGPNRCRRTRDPARALRDWRCTLLRPPISLALAFHTLPACSRLAVPFVLSQNALLMARAYNLLLYLRMSPSAPCANRRARSTPAWLALDSRGIALDLSNEQSVLNCNCTEIEFESIGTEQKRLQSSKNVLSYF